MQTSSEVFEGNLFINQLNWVPFIMIFDLRTNLPIDPNKMSHIFRVNYIEDLIFLDLNKKQWDHKIKRWPWENCN